MTEEETTPWAGGAEETTPWAGGAEETAPWAGGAEEAASRARTWVLRSRGLGEELGHWLRSDREELRELV